MKALVQKLLALGPFGLLALALLDSAGVPLYPGPDLLVVVLASQHPGSAYVYALLATGGSFAGALVLFYLARQGGHMYLERKTATGRGAQLRRWFHHYGLLTVFVPTLVPLVPLPLKVFVLCAGALEVNPLSFAAIILLGRLPRYFGLAYLGSHFGEGAWPYLKGHALQLMGTAVGLFALLFLGIKAIDHWRRQRAMQ